jgi:TonB family protein
MSASCTLDVYSAREIAAAAGVEEQHVAAILGEVRFVGHVEAVRLARRCVRDAAPTGVRGEVVPAPLFALASGRTAAPRRANGLPFALSGTIHGALAAAALAIAAIGHTTNAASVEESKQAPQELRLVFLTTPGPGGGGGGGGLRQKAPAPRALRKGTRTISSPLPVREPPPSVAPPEPPKPTEPPPLEAEPLPKVTAPLVTAPADNRDRVGVLEEARAEQASRGTGEGGGVGTGRGTGLGTGDGTGVGDGSGGGTGGGPYRPGSGVVAPRLLREVKAEYTDEARRRGIRGNTLLEIVVRRDGTVGDVRILKALGGGLDERAIAAVRQWRFAPATRHGSPVDVLVEVTVEFMLR